MNITPRIVPNLRTWIALWGAFCFVVSPTKAEDPVSFNRDIRPILSEYCFACHGPDKNKREADLRLDTQEGLLGTKDHSGAVLPSKPDESLLLQRMITTDLEERMPPPKNGKELKPEEIQLIKKWIAQGAPYEGHWAFQPLRLSAPPTSLPSHRTAHNEIDQFLNAPLDQRQLPQLSEADRITLARRLSFDLTGLPPTPQQIQEFLTDQRTDAYERLVDRLLESEHYGERMAVWWLDLVRYADSVGYHGDQDVSVSPYRDYVIQSFNQNKTFDRFTLEQLAGDLLPGASRETQIAAGYNRLGMMSAEGGVQDKEYLAKYIAERVRNVGGTWLGVTMGCCECHDHKYDPFTMRDFYRMESFFADIEERGLYSGANQSGEWGSAMKVPTAEQEAKLQDFDRSIADLRTKLQETTPELKQAQDAWERIQRSWQPASLARATSSSQTKLIMQDANTILANQDGGNTDTYILDVSSLPSRMQSLRLEVLPDPSLPKRGPGLASNGNFVLTEIRLQRQKKASTTAPTQETPENANSDWEDLAWKSASATFEQADAADKNPYKKWAVAAAIDRDSKGSSWGWAVMGSVGREHHAVFELQEALSQTEDYSYRIVLEQKHENGKHTLGRFRVSTTTEPGAVALHQANSDVLQGLALAPKDRNEQQTKAIQDYYRSIAPSLEPFRKELAKLEADRKRHYESIPSTLITKSVEPRMVRVLARGNWMDEQGEIVLPAYPEVLSRSMNGDSQSSSARLNRLDLAKWLIDPKHPLTSRVLVNRLWKLFYGTGITRKVDDFGAQGEPPSHPEMLDWLAHRMIESGWDVKAMVRLMVTSAAYRRTASALPEQMASDPSNRYYSRQNRYRLDAEFIRDTALASSGLLVRTIGGKSVKPYQPAGYWAYLNFPQREWQNGSGEQLYRRGLYTHWQRQYLHPSLVTFDAPSREECTADRMRSNTPLQSLVLLNDPSFVEAARALAVHALENDGNDASRLEWMVLQVLGRKPQIEELEILQKLLAKHLQDYEKDPELAKKLLVVGEFKTPPQFEATQVASWTSVARTLFNLHEAITRP